MRRRRGEVIVGSGKQRNLPDDTAGRGEPWGKDESRRRMMVNREIVLRTNDGSGAVFSVSAPDKLEFM